MLALIDGDIVAYRVGWTTEKDEFAVARWRVDEMLDGILIDTDSNEFRIYLSDNAENNYRYKIYPEYKANRKTQPRPKFLEGIKEYLITKWSASIAFGQEADDALGINQDKKVYINECKKDKNLASFAYFKTVICSIDKDLQQIPGNHYNFVKKEHSFVTSEEAVQNFYSQILTGDTADNIKGAKGIGPVKAKKCIGHLGADVSALAEAVFKAYLDAFQVTDSKGREEIRAYIEKIGQVLKIKQEESEELWHFPLAKQIQESQSLSSLKTQEEVGQLSEPTTPAWNGVPSLGEKMVGS